MHAPEAFRIADEDSNWATHESTVRAGGADRASDHVLTYWRRRARIGWLGQPVTGRCCNPGCALPTTIAVGWTLADARDPRSSGLWCAPCFLSLLELAGAVGIPIEMPSLNDTAQVA
jgi:hypothetical protein